MAVELKTLRVTADMDASGFKAASEQVAAGANAISTAMKGIGAAITESETKIGRAGSSIDRLSRSYIEGFASAERFNGALRTLSKAIDTGNVSGEQAGRILDGIYRKYNMVADAAELASKGQTGLAQAVEQANARFQAQSRLTPANSNSTNRFLAGNLAAQGQDVLVTALMGMNPGTIGFQQGGQAAGALQMSGVTTLGGAARALGAGLAELVNPLTLATIGLTAGAAAAVQFGVKLYEGGEKAKSASDILKAHEESVRAVADAYGGAMKNLEAYATVSRSLVDLQSRTSNIQLESQLRKEQTDFLKQFGGTSRAAGRFGQASQQLDFTANSDYKPFQEAFRELQATIKNGNPNMDSFYSSVKRIADADPSLQTFADRIVNSVGELDKFARAVTAARDAATRIEINNSGPRLDPLGTFDEARRTADAATSARNPSLYERQQNSLDAFKQGLYARTPEEKAAAARAQAAAQVNPSESSTARDYRVELAGTQALLQAQKELADAQRNRRLDLEKTVQDAQFEIQTIGKTGGEIAALRKEYELTSQLRLEAAKNGTKVDEAEIELIKQKAQELGKLTDLYNRRALQQNISDSFTSLYRTPQDNQIAAMLKQYGQRDDLNSTQAGQIRDLLNAQDMKSSLTSFFTDFRQQIVSNGGDLGKALMTSLENAALNYVGKIWDQMFDQLASNITKSIFGNGVSGNASGGLVGNILQGANQPAVATTSSGGMMGIYQQAIKNIESSGGNYGALGPITASGDRAYGAYQVMGNNIPSWTKQALGYSMTQNQFLASPSAQDAVFNNQFGGYVSKYGASGAAQAWFGGPGSVGSGGSASDILGTTGNEYVAKFNDSVGKATGSLGTMSNGMNTVGNGMTQLGNGMNSAGQKLSSAASGDGGGILSSLLGGLSGYGRSVFSSSAQFASAWKLGGIGLYADGGFTGNKPETAIAGVVHGGEYVFSKSAVDRLGIGNLDAMHKQARGYASGGYVGSMPPAAANGNNAGGVKVNIINNNGSQVSQKSRQSSDGLQLDVMIDEAVAKKISTPGSGTRRAMTSQFGLGGSLAKR